MQIDVDDPNALEIIAASRQLRDAVNRVRTLPAAQAEELLRHVATKTEIAADEVKAQAIVEEARKAEEALEAAEVKESEKVEP